MQIVLTKDDVLEIIKKVFDLEAVGWNKDGTVTIDTVLEKLINDKSNFNTDDLKRMLRKPVPPTPIPMNPSPNPFVPSPFPIYPFPSNPPYKWYTPNSPSGLTQSIRPNIPPNVTVGGSMFQPSITNPAGGSVLGTTKKKVV